MSYVFNMVGGGSGSGGPSASDAILTVTVPTGSTVTMTKGGVTLTPTMWVQAADNTLDCALFVIQPSLFDAVNAWTVTATLGTETASATVTISSNEQYDIVMSYHVAPGYKEVEYIEVLSAGAWWDTGVNANTSRNIEIKIGEDSYVNDKHYFGSPVNAVPNFQMTSFNNRYYWGNGQQENNGGTWRSGIKVFTYNNAANSYIPTVNGVNLTNSNMVTLADSNIYLGRRGSSINFTGEIYYCFIKNNSDQSFVRRMYPCYRISDSAVGFWDNVNGAFYGNLGSGTVVAGPDV